MPAKLVMDTFFTEAAQDVLVRSEKGADLLNHDYLGVEHLLMGLVSSREDSVARFLSDRGVTPGRVNKSVMFIVGRGRGRIMGEYTILPRVRRVLHLAQEAAQSPVAGGRIAPVHLLIGILREGESVGAGVLASLVVSSEALLRDAEQMAKSVEV